MSQADTLLENLTDEQIQTYTADPETEPYEVDIGDDQFIIVPDELKRIAVQHEHNVKRIRFRCPRYSDGCDMAGMAIYINYMRPNKTTGFSVAESIVTTNDKIYFDWVITREVTTHNGSIAFLVCIKKVVENADGETEETNHWNSELNTDCYISEGLEVDHSEEFISYDPDIVTSMLTRIGTVERTADEVFDRMLTVEDQLKEYAAGQGFVSRFGDEFDGDLKMNGSLTLTNADEAPSKVEVTNRYSTRATANGLSVVDNSTTEMKLIEGNTIRSTNRLPYPYILKSGTINGVEVTVRDDGSIQFNGQATGGIHVTIAKWTGGKKFRGRYTFSVVNALPTGSYFWIKKPGETESTKLTTAGNVSVTVTLDGEYDEFGMWLSIDGEFKSVRCFPMLVSGGADTTYHYPFVGLKNAKIGTIVSTGRNLLNIPKNFTFTRAFQLYNIKLPAGTYYFNCGSYSKGGASAPVMVVKDALTSRDMKGFPADKGLQSITLPSGTYTIQFYSNGWNYVASEGVTSSITDLMFCRGSAMDYEPYTEDIYQLPEPIELGKWDEIDIKRGVRTISTDTYTFTGEENLTAWSGANGVIGAYLSGAIDYDNSLGTDIRGVCNHYDVIANSSTTADMIGLRQLDDGDQRVYFRDSRYTSVDAWKAHLKELYDAGTPLVLTYKRKTPIVEPIDNLRAGYSVFDGGMESVYDHVPDTANRFETDTSRYGVVPTITQVYYESVDPEKAATQEYVNAGLSNKVDKFTLKKLEQCMNSDVIKLKAYADQSETDAVATAKTYTDGQISTLDTNLKKYADQSETDAVATAKTYTDGKTNSRNGSITILSTDWAGSTTCTKTISNLGAVDAIFFTPKTITDRDLVSAVSLFAEADGSTVTFRATSTPTKAITLKYFIIHQKSYNA